MATDSTSVPLTSEQQMNVFRLRDKMSLLNAEFLVVFNGFYAEKNHYDFSVTMNSYMDHVKQLKVMYKVDGEVAVAAGTTSLTPTNAVLTRAENTSPKYGGVQRKIAKAVRKNGPATNSLDSSKVEKSTVFASSSPATFTSVPKFGDISVIAKDVPTPRQQTTESNLSSAPVAARKRAIRGGGPSGDTETVIFKSGGDPQASTSSVTIPATTIKFPEPSKDFWVKKDTNSSNKTAPNNGESLFAFLGKGADKTKEATKFSGFKFGKKADEGTDGKQDVEPAKKLIFGETKNTESPQKSSAGSPLGSVDKTTSATVPSNPPTESKEANESATSTKPFAALSFGASLFGSSSTTSNSTLSFGTSGGTSTSGSLFSGFAGLAQKAMENKSKPEGGDDEEGEYVPPKVETVEIEEPDAVYSSKVSVFKFTGKEYSKLGIGMLHVKEIDGKFSLLIRAATATGTVWLNALCNKTMKATKVDEKGERVRLTCPTSAKEFTTMMIRFGTATGAKKFTDKIEEVSK